MLRLRGRDVGLLPRERHGVSLGQVLVGSDIGLPHLAEVHTVPFPRQESDVPAAEPEHPVT